MPVPSIGPKDATIMVVGEAPDVDEVAKGKPFVGYSGQLLDSLLAGVGVARSDVFLTNVCKERPPKNDISVWLPATKVGQEALMAEGQGTSVKGRIVHPHIATGYAELLQEIENVRPRLIIALGNTALWATTGLTGIASWRGSTLEYDSLSHHCIVVPTYHPAVVLRQYSLLPVVKQDLRRAMDTRKRGIPKPIWNFTVRPTFWQVETCLRRLLEQAHSSPLLLSCDIETRLSHTTCLGIAWTQVDALCIPFVSSEKPEGYWTEGEEGKIVWYLYRLLTHPNVKVVGQNFIYDAQYIYRYWHFIPNLAYDTMLAQHVCFSRMTKSLDYIASMYNDYYVYWKDDGKDWRGDGDEERYWKYNCEDCVRTLEAHYTLQHCVDQFGLRYAHDFQLRMWKPVLRMMLRGIKVDPIKHQYMRQELTAHADLLLKEVNEIIGYEINIRSFKQMQAFFYEEMGLPVQKKRGKGTVSCDDEALTVLGRKEPLVRPIVERIQEARSALTLCSNALKAGALGFDKRMHSSFNIAGTATFRLSSSEDAFGSGMNLQNITSGNEDD